MSVEPNGRIERDPAGGTVLVLSRDFAAPIEDVWASITDSARLARWIGTFTGDPASGRVLFQMTAEGDGPPSDVVIDECDPPRLLAVTSQTEGGGWRMRLALTEIDGGTRLTFSQPGIDPAQADSIGPGWEYYLDRLVAAETGGDVSAIDFDRDYYPAMQEYYRTQVG